MKIDVKKNDWYVVHTCDDDDEYVPFSVATQLRKKGFDMVCRSRFYQKDPDGGIEAYNAAIGENFNREELVNSFSRPTLQMVLLWLHKKGIHPCVNWHISVNKYYATIIGKANAEYSVGFYEELSVAWLGIILYSLENLL